MAWDYFRDVEAALVLCLGQLDSAFESATWGCFQDAFAPFAAFVVVVGFGSGEVVVAAFVVAGFGSGEVVVGGAFEVVASVADFA